MKLNQLCLLLLLVTQFECPKALSEDTLGTMPKKQNDSPAAKGKSEAYDASVPEPTVREVKYGEHPRHVIDFWQAKSDKPTPLVFVIHGGGWQGGSKERLQRFADANALLEAGISVAACNYRYVKQAVAEGIQPPVKAPLHDAARALQFIRSKSEEWNLDKNRIGAAGGSAGACSSLWLAFHDDLAEPDSDDPVRQESTRLWCAAVTGAQTSLDPKQMKEWTPNSRYGGHAFGFGNFSKFLAGRDSILPWIAEYSPFALVSGDDPGVYLTYSRPPALGKNQKDPTHTANFGVKLQEECHTLGVECELMYPGAKGTRYKTPTEYLIAELLKESPKK
ncbi:MAG: alpha/beta hydrolase fold domain-containing protein [Aureliella sp.]